MQSNNGLLSLRRYGTMLHTAGVPWYPKHQLKERESMYIFNYTFLQHVWQYVVTKKHPARLLF